MTYGVVIKKFPWNNSCTFTAQLDHVYHLCLNFVNFNPIPPYFEVLFWWGMYFWGCVAVTVKQLVRSSQHVLKRKCEMVTWIWTLETKESCNAQRASIGQSSRSWDARRTNNDENYNHNHNHNNVIFLIGNSRTCQLDLYPDTFGSSSCHPSIQCCYWAGKDRTGQDNSKNFQVAHSYISRRFDLIRFNTCAETPNVSLKVYLNSNHVARKLEIPGHSHWQ